MKKLDYQKNARIIWAAAALLLYLIYVVFDFYLMRLEYSYDAVTVKTGLLQNLQCAFPYIALLLFAVFERTLKYVNPRIYLFLVLLLLLNQYMNMDYGLLQMMGADAGRNSIYFFEQEEIVYFIVVMVLVYIPAIGSTGMKFFTGFLAFVYVLKFSLLVLDYLDTGYMFINLLLGPAAWLMFTYALYRFSDVLTDENKSRICRKIDVVLFQPMMDKVLKWLELDEDEEWMDEFLEDEEFLEEEEEVPRFWSLSEDREKLMLYALCQEEEKVILAFQILENMSSRRFLDKEGKLYKADFIMRQLVVLREAAKRVNETQAGYCSDEFLAVVKELIQNRENPTFMAQVVNFAEHIYDINGKDGLHIEKWTE